MLIRQTLLYLPAQIAGPLAQLAAAIVWTFWLTPEQLGGYALIWSIQELASVAVLGWWSAFVQRYASGLGTGDRRQDFERLEIVVQLGAVAAQILITVLAVLILFPADATAHMFVAIAAFTIVRTAAGHFAIRARAQGEAVAYTINVVCGALGGLALGLAALQIWAPRLDVLLWAYAIAQALGLLISFWFMQVGLARPAIDRRLAHDAWRFGWPVTASSGLMWVGAHAIRFVVEFTAGRTAVGLMSVGWWLGLRLASFAGVLVMGAAYNVAVERMRTEGPDAARAQLSEIAVLLIGLLAPLCVGGWMLAGPLAAHLVDPDYRDMTAAILPAALAAGALRVFQDSCVDAGFLVFERPRFPAIISAVDAVAAILGCVVGLWVGGISGAVWGAALGALATSIVGLMIAHRVYGFRVDLVDLARIACAAAAMAVVLALLAIPTSLAGLLGTVALGAAAYGAALLAMFPKLRAALARR
jgi:O-antigen/teichoic acid export membrane protein